MRFSCSSRSAHNPWNTAPDYPGLVFWSPYTGATTSWVVTSKTGTLHRPGGGWNKNKPKEVKTTVCGTEVHGLLPREELDGFIVSRFRRCD